ncbi:MAG TPA: PQQ-dependent dehydrogenase, methanol/ethanol family, partial [Thermoanaerobaculia bacterium]|nr:PQQ-dependent dehydrogenase, methanol/ethanol family [Thermoanaerobaculia bacterium]
PSHPVTQTQTSFGALNETSRQTAPDVTRSVTPERIRNARSEPQNWLTYYGAYDGQRYSSLDQIDTGNVKSLRPAWQFQFGVIGLVANPATYSFEAAPIVVDGVMFISGWDGYVWALDATNGTLLWQYKHSIPLDTPLCCGNVNRGVAVASGRVYVATQNGHLVALDATNGHKVWEQVFADVRAGESATAAPLVVKDLILVGSSGGEYGVRGHLDAFDLASGARRWRRYNVPKPGEPGSDTWGNEDWQRGGGSSWITGTYDPDLDLVFWGTSNPGPDFDGSVRPGSNLYTSSVVAIDPDDGSLRWHYQWTPHDVWDYDGVNENILIDDGPRKLLAHFDKNGYLFVLDRTNGRFVRAVKYARATWGDIDPTTGNVTPRINPTPEGAQICPGPAGAKEWPHASYNRETHLLYTPVVEACGTFRLLPQKFREGMAYWGGDVKVDKEQWGHVKAYDPLTGREVWSWRAEQPMVASLLTTAGNLVFAGEPSGRFNAFDARSGELLWSFQTGSGIHSNPVTYSVNGKQYIAVPTGWGGWVDGYAPEMYGAPRGTALVVFALP